MASGQTAFSNVLPRISRYIVSNNATITPNKNKNNPIRGALTNLLIAESATSPALSIRQNKFNSRKKVVMKIKH
jgi:hypothetical protein